MTFSNDYYSVQKALHDGRVVESSTELGGQFTQMVRAMRGLAPEPKEEPKKRFSELLSIVPGRFSLFSDGKKTAS
jgi:hypothetical protein